jgi:hypothetical protein
LRRSDLANLENIGHNRSIWAENAAGTEDAGVIDFAAFSSD